MNESGRNGLGIDEKTAPKKETDRSQSNGVIAWGDTQYEIEKFRSLVFNSTGDFMKEGHDGT